MKYSQLYTVEGIILKRKAAGEADKILTIFTKEQGKMRVLARGIRKIHSRRAGHVELFSRVVLTLHMRQSMDVMTEAQAIVLGSRFETDSGRMAYAYCMSELVDQLLADRQEHRDVFYLLADALAELLARDSSEMWQATMSTFVHELLWVLGFLPRLRQISAESMQSYVEHITERKLRTWPLLRALS